MAQSEIATFLYSYRYVPSYKIRPDVFFDTSGKSLYSTWLNAMKQVYEIIIIDIKIDVENFAFHPYFFNVNAFNKVSLEDTNLLDSEKRYISEHSGKFLDKLNRDFIRYNSVKYLLKYGENGEPIDVYIFRRISNQHVIDVKGKNYLLDSHVLFLPLYSIRANLNTYIYSNDEPRVWYIIRKSLEFPYQIYTRQSAFDKYNTYLYSLEDTLAGVNSPVFILGYFKFIFATLKKYE